MGFSGYKGFSVVKCQSDQNQACVKITEGHEAEINTMFLQNIPDSEELSLISAGGDAHVRMWRLGEFTAKPTEENLVSRWWKVFPRFSGTKK